MATKKIPKARKKQQSESKGSKAKKSPKYIFVVGGVISGVGKGIAASSIGKILQDRGLVVTAIKIDPYVNVDAGTMNPTEHGEVFVTNDGDETDQDMGNYERFLNITLNKNNYMTTGRVYQSVINQERNLEFGGKCVQVVPHIPMEVIRRIKNAQKEVDADVVMIEVGGTVGEYENIVFLEAARMLKIEDYRSVLCVMVSYLPIPSKVGEMKTKPTQHAVRTLGASGIQPDIIIARSQVPLDDRRKEKLSFFCNLPPERIISAPDIDSVYDVPINFEKEKLSDLLCGLLGATCSVGVSAGSRAWKSFARTAHTATEEVKIAVIGKYFETGDFTLADSYVSVIEAVKYSAYGFNKKASLTWISAIDFEKDPKSVSRLKEFDAILVPGGFGARGVEGLLTAINYARVHKIPYLGLCYGMQLAVIEYARNVLGLTGATTREINPKAEHLLIDIMESQKSILAEGKFGNTMRLGAYEAHLTKGSLVARAYKSTTVSERHRHRYEVNNAYKSALEAKGLVFSGTSPDGKLMEYIELPESVHPFFVATQAHPEFKARPLDPHPLFTAFVKAAILSKKK